MGIGGISMLLILWSGCLCTGHHRAGARTALHLAAENGHGAVVQLLLKEGADIEAKDESGYTALSMEAKSGNKAIVQLLLEEGADIASENNMGKTALHVAAEWGHEAV